MSQLDLADYHAIIAIFTHRHFGRAAEHLGVSQPSLTARLKRMEDRFGARFFDRDRRGVEPTAVGLALFDAAQDVIASAQTAERTARDAVEGRGQIVRVGFTQIVAQTVLVGALRAIRLRHTKLRLQVTEASTAQLERGLEARTLDIAFLHPPVQTPGLRQRVVHACTGLRLRFGPEDGQTSMIGYPNREAPVLMTALADAAGDSDAFASVADTVLGAVVLARAGFGEAIIPGGYDHPLIASAEVLRREPLDLTLQTAVAARATDRRPIIAELFDVAVSQAA
ncbi:MAG: LysR family transcriptional regulator [Pseudomonadota bacterium]